MDLIHEMRKELGVALNEATLVDVNVDTSSWTGYVTLAVLTIPNDGPPPDDNRILLVLRPVGRIAASLRLGRWDDPTAPVESFSIDQLSDVVRSFGQLPVYGWNFFDVPDSEEFDGWADRPSLDALHDPSALTHTLDLFQEDGVDCILELRLWFSELEIRDPADSVIPLARFAAGGRRWWDAPYRSWTDSRGIHPLR